MHTAIRLISIVCSLTIVRYRARIQWAIYCRCFEVQYEPHTGKGTVLNTRYFEVRYQALHMVVEVCLTSWCAVWGWG